MEELARMRTKETLSAVSEVVDIDALVEVFSQLTKHGVDKGLAAELVVAESMSMVVAEATDVPMIDMMETAEPMLMSIGLLEGAEPVLVDHIMARAG